MAGRASGARHSASAVSAATCAAMLAQKAARAGSEVAEAAREVVADDVGAAAAVDVGGGALVPGDGVAQDRGHHAGGIGVAEELAEDLLAGADGAARALAVDAAPAQGLVGRGQAEGLGERDAAAQVRDADTSYRTKALARAADT